MEAPPVAPDGPERGPGTCLLTDVSGKATVDPPDRAHLENAWLRAAYMILLNRWTPENGLVEGPEQFP